MALDGEPVGAVTLLERLNALGSRHGVGRADVIEEGWYRRFGKVEESGRESRGEWHVRTGVSGRLASSTEKAP